MEAKRGHMDFDEEIDDMSFMNETHRSSVEIEGEFPEDDIYDTMDEIEAYGVV